AVRRLPFTTPRVSSEPTTGGTLAPALLLKFAVAGALSLGVVMLVPRTVSGGGDVPPVRMLIETAVIVSVICALALFWGIRSDLRLPVKVGLYAVLFLLGIGSGGAILILLLPLFGGLDYLDFVFSSGVSLLVALALAAATAFAALAFDATSKRAHALGDATMYMSFFWVGLYFLALYHVLWVVYVLVLTSIWPLKVVTPK